MEDRRTLAVTLRLDRPFHELKRQLLATFERAYVMRMLELTRMNVSQASRSSGLSRKHMRALMAKYGMTVDRRLEVAAAG